MKPKFTNKAKGYSVPFIGAKKTGADSYESETECKARIESMFDVDDVECFWDAERNPPGFVAGPHPEIKPPGEEVSDEVIKEANEMNDEVDEAEGKLAVTPSADLPPKGFTEPGEDAPANTESDEPIPSVDGARTYDLSKKATFSMLDTNLSRWEWEYGAASLLDKLDEEAQEAREGDQTKPTLNGDDVTVIGTSSCSEMITVGVIVFKYLSQYCELNAQQVLTLINQRHDEQYERYNASKTDPEPEMDEDTA